MNRYYTIKIRNELRAETEEIVEYVSNQLGIKINQVDIFSKMIELGMKEYKDHLDYLFVTKKKKDK